MAFTLLRDSFTLDFFPLFADEEGVIRGPAGSGRVAAVARDDVADVAAVVLRDAAVHAGATSVLTGPEAVSMSDAVRWMTSVLGRPYRYEEQSLDEASATRRECTDQRWQLDARVSTYTAIASDALAAVSDDVPSLTGHTARRLEDATAPR